MPARPESLVNNDVGDGLLAHSCSYKLIDLGSLVVYHNEEPPKDRFLPVRVSREWAVQSSTQLGDAAWPLTPGTDFS